MSTELDQSTKHPQLEVQRKLGRCLLLLQYVEYLMKEIVVQHAIDGQAAEIDSVREKRAAFYANKTMGVAVEELKTSFLRTTAEPKELKQAAESSSDWMSFHHGIRMSDENYARWIGELDDLVQQRNELVHHFIEKFDVWSEAGCRQAETHLDAYFTRIESVYQQVAKWHESMCQTRRMFASVMENPAVTDLMVHGIAPDGQVAIWAFTPIVELLREAESSLAEKGWAPLQEAKRFIHERDPEQTPEKYGCHSWQQLLYDSGLFLIERRKDAEGPAWRRWYRSKSPESTT